MTLPNREWTPLEDDDLEPQTLADTPEGEDAPQAGTDADAAPEPEQTPAFPAAVAGFDFTAMNELVASERDRQAQARQPAPQTAAEWASPYERPGAQERLDALLEQSFDPASMQEYQRLTRGYEAEIRAKEMDDRFGQMAQNIQLQNSAPSMAQTAFNSVKGGYTDQLTAEDFSAVANEIFPDAANMARALDDRFNPMAQQTRQMIADAAYGKKMRAGGFNAPAAPKPPPGVRSAGRPPIPLQPMNELTDPQQVDDVIAALSRKRK